MIDENRLNEWATWLRDQPAANIEEIDKLIRLARLGQWAEQHGVGALREIFLCGGIIVTPMRDIEQTGPSQWSAASVEARIAKDALAALPKEKT